MSTPANHWKLGLFVLLGACAAVGAVLYFGARSFETENVRYKSYFDESVPWSRSTQRVCVFTFGRFW